MAGVTTEDIEELLQATKWAFEKDPPKYYFEWNGEELVKKFVNG